MDTINQVYFSNKSTDACDYCHGRKIRCDKRKPQCYECIKRGIQCMYGQKRKRGPKVKTKHKRQPQQPDQQIHNTHKPSIHLQTMLLELEFNKKMVELWRTMHNNISEGKVRPPPKFDPSTEQFLRDPQAAKHLMEEFNDTYRLIYILPTFATSIDLGTKLWNVLLGLHLADLLSIINTFETSILVLILEYFVVFTLGTKLRKYNDVAAYIAKVTRHMIDTILYARDGTNDNLTPEMTLQLLPSMTLLSNYYRPNKNVLAVHYNSYATVYHRLMVTSLFSKELEARMICRRILCGKLTREEREGFKKRFQELNDEGVIGPSILYHFNHHLSVIGLRSAEDLPEGERAIQKAEFYINWHLDQLPPDKRPAIEGFYFTRLSITRIELSLRLGNFDIAQQRAGQVIFTFSRLPSEIKQMLVSYCEYFSNNYKLSMDYTAMLTNPGVTPMMKTNLLISRPDEAQQDDQDKGCERDGVHLDEWLDLLESVENSPPNETGILIGDAQGMTTNNLNMEEDLFFDFAGIINTN